MRFMIVVKSAESAGPPPDGAHGRDREARRGGDAGRRDGPDGRPAPQRDGARVRLSAGKLTVTDGPFAETKELIGGYAVYDVKSKQEAIEWASRFMQLHKDHWPGWEGESEIRQIFDAPQPTQGKT